MIESLSRWSEKWAAWLGERTQFGIRTNTPGASVAEPVMDIPMLHHFLPYVAFDPTTGLYYNQNSQGFILETCPLLGASEETVTILAGLLTDSLPQQADLQFILWGSPQVGPLLDRFESTRQGGHVLIPWLAKKRTDYLKQLALMDANAPRQGLVRDIRLFVAVSQARAEAETTARELMTLRDDLTGSLQSLQLPVLPVAADEFVRVFSDVLRPSSSPYPSCQRWNPYDALSQQLVDPENRIQVYPDRLLMDRKGEAWEARVLSVKEYPQTAAQWKMTDAIGQLFNASLQIPSSFVMTFSLRLLDPEKAVFQSQMKTASKEKTARSPLARFIPAIGKEHQDWAFVQQRLSEGDKLVSVYYQMVLFARANEAGAVERKVRDLYRANGWRLKTTRYLQLQSYLAMLPMTMSEGLYEDMRSFGRLQTMTAFNAMNLAPLQGEWKGTRTPGLLLVGRRGQLAGWGPFDNDRGNYNIAITAAPGKGKSVLVSEMIVATLGANGQVQVIDQGHSQQKTCRLLGGEFIEFRPHSPLCLNPFSTITDFDESINMLKPIIASMARPLRGVTEEEMSYIEQAIKGAYERDGTDTTIKRVSQWLAEQSSDIAKNLSHLLYSYTEGIHAAIYEGRCTIDFSNPFIVWELQGLKNKKELRNNVLQLLIYQISQKMYESDRSQIKSCIIDEAWDLFDDNHVTAGKFIEAGYRTARKFRGNFISIAHSVSDFHKNPMSKAAFDCSDFKIMLGQTDEAINKLKNDNIMELDGFTERLLKSLRITRDYSECIIDSPDGLSLHRLVLDPFSRILFSTKGDEFDAVERWQQQGDTLVEAIERVARAAYPGVSSHATV